MTPIVDGLERTYQGRVVFRWIDANGEDGPAIVRDYNILGHPAILILDQTGAEISRFFGPQSAADLEALLQQIIAEMEE